MCKQVNYREFERSCRGHTNLYNVHISLSHPSICGNIVSAIEVVEWSLVGVFRDKRQGRLDNDQEYIVDTLTHMSIDTGTIQYTPLH